jgi:hypothetical protein
MEIPGIGISTGYDRWTKARGPGAHPCGSAELPVRDRPEMRYVPGVAMSDSGIGYRSIQEMLRSLFKEVPC